MNGSCAGGTGAFIDQMATLLDTDAAGLNDSPKHEKIYPIASRCGVFAKTDPAAPQRGRGQARRGRLHLPGGGGPDMVGLASPRAGS